MPIKKEGQMGPNLEKKPDNQDINTLIDQSISALGPVVRSFFSMN